MSETNKPEGAFAQASGYETVEWCDAGGQPVGYGATEQIGDAVECPVCGRRVKLRDQIGRYFSNTPAYPRHKRQTHNDKMSGRAQDKETK